MSKSKVMHNGTTVIDDYGQNLDKLKVGDRVAVVRKEGGTVHFFVNRYYTFFINVFIIILKAVRLGDTQFALISHHHSSAQSEF